MNRLSFAALTIFITGCGGSMNTTTQSEHVNKPLVTTAHTPYIEVMGDQQALDLVAYANSQGNTLWKCSTCGIDQLSGVTLSSVSAVIARKPDFVFINTGAADYIINYMQSHSEPTVNNMIQIQDELNDAGIKSGIMEIPNSDRYDDYYDDVALVYEYQAGVISELFGGDFDYGSSGTIYPTSGDNADWTQNTLERLYPELWSFANSLGAGGGNK